MNDSVQQDECKVDDFLQQLNSLDFGPLAFKLMNPEDRQGMSLEQALDAIKKYKGFLFLYYINRGQAISPSRYIDYVWHTHVLDTELYLTQSAMLFGHYLHHFPFFGKRGEADQNALLAAADFTKRQASYYFGWDEDDWCGTGRRPPVPGPRSGIAELAKVIFPAGLEIPGANANPNSISIQTGSFRHTIEHIGLGIDTIYSPRPEPWYDWGPLLKLPPWVIVCYPVDISVLNDIFVIRGGEKLAEVARGLAQRRLTPSGYSGAQVELRIGTQAVRA